MNKKNFKTTIGSRASAYDSKTRVFGQTTKIPTMWSCRGQSFIKRKGVKNERRREPSILVQGLQTLSNYLHLFLNKIKITLIEILHYCCECSNFWRNAINTKPIMPLFPKDPNLSRYPLPPTSKLFHKRKLICTYLTVKNGQKFKCWR